MNEVLYIFEEAVSKGWLKETVSIVRKNGKVFDYVLEGEPIQTHEVVTVESLADVMTEIRKY